MKIDLAIPSYRGLLHPRAKQAIDNLLFYSGCSCFQQNAELADRMYQALQSGRRMKDLPAHNPFHPPSLCPYGKHDIFVIPQVNSCVIHWSRNDLLVRRRPDADYVLFCDDDIVVQRDTLERMLAPKKDIVAALCTRRVDPPEPNFRQWIEDVQNYGVILKWPVGKFLEVDAVGTGLMLLSRNVIEDVAKAYHPALYKETGNGFWFDFLRAPSEIEWGEDMSFCFKAQRLGYKIHVDTSICPEHMGDFGFAAEDFLQYQDAILEAGGLNAYRKKELEALAQRTIPTPAEEKEFAGVT